MKDYKACLSRKSDLWRTPSKLYDLKPFPKYQYVTKKELQRFIDEGY